MAGKRGVVLSLLGLRSARATRGFVALGPYRFPCAIGRTGRVTRKREGDGATPIGIWRLRQAFYRADRIGRPRTGLPIRSIRRSDGWSDDPADRNYNRLVKHPYPVSAEHLWREDGLYDLVVVLGCNDVPRRRGGGSAIFMHVARPGFLPTAGCVALRLKDLECLLARVGRAARIRIPA